MSVIVIIAVTYLLTSLLGWIVHWSIHHPWTGKFNEMHMAHHVKLYPPKSLESDGKYRSSETHGTALTFFVAFLPLLLIPIALYVTGVFSLVHALTALLAMGLVGALNDVVHNSFHVKDHWFRRFVPNFKKMQELHFVHHRRMKRNFGIFSMIWDKAFRSFTNK